MTNLVDNLLVATLYLILSTTLAYIEYRRISRNGVNSQTILVLFIFIYILIHSLSIHLILGTTNGEILTGIYFFDKVLTHLNLTESLLVFFLVLCFIAGLYLVLNNSNKKNIEPKYTLVIDRWKSTILLTCLWLVCTKFFLDLGDNFLERYAKVILFRSLDADSDRNFFTANAFSLTQTLAWLSAGMFFLSLKSNKRFYIILFLIFTATGLIVSGSRRGLIFIFLIIYLSSLVNKKNIGLRKIIWLVPFLLLWLSFGKELTGSVANNGQIIDVVDQYDNIGSALLRSFCDIGITQIQTYAVLQHFDLTLRLGIDHILSVLRRFPDGMIGLNIDWPERIVRITTESFTYKEDADIPPGLIGQSWLDFPVLGAFVWGALIGIQIRILHRWSSTVIQSPEKSVLITLITIIIAMPINTGSYDFTFSVDILALLFILSLIYNRKKLLTSYKLKLEGN